MVKIKYPKSENELRESLCYNHSSYCFWGCHQKKIVKNESSFAFIETKLEGDFSFMLNVTIIILMYTFYYTHSWNERVNFGFGVFEWREKQRPHRILTKNTYAT